MTSTLWVIVATVSGVIVLLVILKMIFRSMARSLQAEVRQRFHASKILRQEPFANFFGRKSRGLKQVRGNGALVLTRETLWFMRAAPRKEFTIPLDHVTGVTFHKTFLGKTIFRPLLCVEFETKDGPDAIAWAVRDPHAWREAIDAARKGG